MRKVDDILIKESVSIREVLKIIDLGALKIAIVVGILGELIGTVTDGDVRRGLLRGLTLDDSIETIIYRKPTVAHLNYTSDEILQIAIEKRIYQIPIIDDAGKVVGIEEIDELLNAKEKDNLVVLMAGGIGERLRPLTKDVPKPLLKVGNKPILETIINNFKKYGFRRFLISVNYKSEMIEEYFGDGTNLSVDINYAYETKKLGTAGSLALIETTEVLPIIVMNGDLLTSVNFDHMLDYHIQHGSCATMGVRDYDFQVPYGVVSVKENVILSIKEKPTHKFFVNAGVYILDPVAILMVPPDSFFDMPSLFGLFLKKNDKVISFPIHEYWRDIGRIDEYNQANKEYNEVF